MDEVRLLRDPGNAVPASSVVTAVSETVVACLAPLFRLLGDELRLIRESMCTLQIKTPFIVGMHLDSEGDASKEVTPHDDDYDADLEAFEAQMVLLSPSLHLSEEETTYRAAMQSECSTFFRGVSAAMATSATALAHRCVVVPVVALPAEIAPARYNPVVEAETVARRFHMDGAAAAHLAIVKEMVSVLGALAIRTTARNRAEVRFLDGEADARRELEFAAFAPLSTFVPLSDTSVIGSVSEGDVHDAHAVASDHGDAAVRPIVRDHRDSDTVHGCEPPPTMRFDPRYNRTVPT